MKKSEMTIEFAGIRGAHFHSGADRSAVSPESPSELPVATEIKNDRYTAAIAKRVAKLRKERGFTQVELAKKLKTPQSIISRYERGELRLHGDLLIKLAKVLEVTPNDLLGIDSDNKATEAIPRQWLKRLQKIKSLSRRDHEALLRTVDAFLKSSS